MVDPYLEQVQGRALEQVLEQVLVRVPVRVLEQALEQEQVLVRALEQVLELRPGEVEWVPVLVQELELVEPALVLLAFLETKRSSPLYVGIVGDSV